jgi:hypothetical protein
MPSAVAPPSPERRLSQFSFTSSHKGYTCPHFVLLICIHFRPSLVFIRFRETFLSFHSFEYLYPRQLDDSPLPSAKSTRDLASIPQNHMSVGLVSVSLAWFAFCLRASNENLSLLCVSFWPLESYTDMLVVNRFCEPDYIAA